MKKLIFFFAFSLIFLTQLHQGYCLGYKDTFIPGVREEENTQENIDQAKLLEKYIRNYRKDIESLEKKYGIEDSFVISKYKKELDSMVRSLRNTETFFIEKSDAEEIKNDVVLSLKAINILIKEILKKEQTRYENKKQTIKEIYSKIGIKMSGVIGNLTKNMTGTLSKKETLSASEKDIVRSLVKLNEVNQSIKDFSRENFASQEEMKLYYTDIIRKIRTEISLIKKLVSN